MEERKTRIAVVEDDERLRELWQAVLEPEYQVDTFEDGEAFSKVTYGDYDVALIDLVLRPGGMHGITVIRSASRWVTCIGISGSSDTDRASAHLAGAKMVVEKPAAIKGVREVVRAALLLYGSKRA